MTDAQFDELIHAPLRLRICGLLRRVAHLDFAVLRDTLSVSDATLSKHLRTLIDAGYVSSSKVTSEQRGDARRITWLSLTSVGEVAFDAHLAALQEITGAAPATVGDESGTSGQEREQVSPSPRRS